MIIVLLKKHFQILLRFHGRAGRADIRGRVLIQTSDTNNYILSSIVKNDYTGFYNNEIKFRRKFEYPPFIDIFLFEFISKDIDLLKKSADRMYKLLSSNNRNYYKVFSPKTPFIQKINNKYRINILIKTKVSNELYKILYDKIDLYNESRNKDVNMSITKNPIFLN